MPCKKKKKSPKRCNKIENNLKMDKQGFGLMIVNEYTLTGHNIKYTCPNPYTCKLYDYSISPDRNKSI